MMLAKEGLAIPPGEMIAPMFPIPLFVTSTANSHGTGKLIEVRGKKATIEYFDSPTQKTRMTETVPIDRIQPAPLDEQTRVYYLDPKTKSWHAGRALAATDDGYWVAFPNDRKEAIAIHHLYVRWDHPICDPTDLLAARISETPFFHDARNLFVRSLIEQRAACGGMSGLLSSVIDLERHQIEVVRRVLQDPIQRYLLADEVGLGKTIEAGILIRQYVLDRPADHGVLILVPPHLIQQWREELINKFRLSKQLDLTIHILAADDAKAIAAHAQQARMLVIDEAHHIANLVSAGERSADRKRFELIRGIALKADRLLLLSATPLLHNEVAFQAMLHMLDPVIYPLGAMAAFRERVERWQQTAELFHVFSEKEAGPFLETVLEQLREMFPKDGYLKQLATELQPYLDYDRELDDPERVRLIRSIRTHISETYRLHRRLLRNRRGNEDTETLLPGRVGLFVQDYADTLAVQLETWIEEWRAKAAPLAAKRPDGPAATKLGDFLFLLLESTYEPLIADALLALRLDGDRKAASEAGLTDAEITIVKNAPEVPGEKAIFQAMRKAIKKEKGEERLKALQSWLMRILDEPAGNKSPVKVVLFASHTTSADRIFHRLQKALGSGVVRHQETREEWERFRTEPSCRVLVCDRQAEDGLNLQGSRMYLVHYDLPFAPNRMEQRMGRLDRYGVGSPVRSFTFVAGETPIIRGWITCLADAFLVFERSIASLQYLVDQELQVIRRELLQEGTAALQRATDRLGGPEGAVEKALAEIQKLDEFEAIEVMQDEEEPFAERLRQIELDRKDAWNHAVQSLLVNQLRFGDWGINGASDPVRRYYFQRPKIGHQTLMPVSRLERQFFDIIDRAAEDRFRPAIYPVTHDRHIAQRRQVFVDAFVPGRGRLAVSHPISLLRIGDPFIDGLAEYVRWDDRGVCFALWRVRPGVNTASPADLAFRFDFLIEADIAPAQAILARNPHATPESLRRQADQLFPPIIQTTWLTGELTPLTDARRIALLEEPYRKGSVPRSRDYNINLERWKQLETSYDAAGWRSLCVRARKAAEKALRDQLQLKELTEKLARKAELAAAIRHTQFESRLVYLAPAQRKGEKANLKLDQKLSGALEQGIRNPAIRLDAIGAVFLSNQDPFDRT